MKKLWRFILGGIATALVGSASMIGQQTIPLPAVALPGTVNSVPCYSNSAYGTPVFYPCPTQPISSPVSISQGGTGQTTAPASYNAISQTDIVPILTSNQIAGTADSYTSIQACLTAAATSPYPRCYIPTGTFITSAGLVCNSSACKIAGATAFATSITASGTGYATLTVGPGTLGGTPTGYTRDIALYGASRTSNGIPAFQLNGTSQYEVTNVMTGVDDIGFGLENNCAGSIFYNIHVAIGGSTNVGVYLGPGSANGSDLTFINPWLGGQIAGMTVAGTTGGIHIVGGQVNAGQGTGSLNDNAASFWLGKDYLSQSTTGQVTMDVYGTSSEGGTYSWVFRAYDQVQLTTHGMGLNPTSSGAPAIGVYKNSNAKNSTVLFESTGLSGYFSAASLISDGGGFSNDSYIEIGTYSAVQNPTINSVSTYVSCMTSTQSGLANAVCLNNNNNVITNSINTAVFTTNGGVKSFPSGAVTLPQTVASGTATLGTSAVSSGTCATVVTVAGSGIATTDSIGVTFSADPTSTTGYSPSATGMLTIIPYPTSGNANFKVCNNTSASITPGAATLNWKVVR